MGLLMFSLPPFPTAFPLYPCMACQSSWPSDYLCVSLAPKLTFTKYPLMHVHTRGTHIHHMSTHTHTPHMYTHAHTYTCPHNTPHMCTHTCTHMHTHTYTTCPHMCTLTCTHTYTTCPHNTPHMCTLTCTHMHTHMYTRTYSEGAVSPCSLILGLLYIKRLSQVNPNYVSHVSSRDLFLTAMVSLFSTCLSDFVCACV